MRPAALLFDMDGTLTRPMLDFPAIKAEMGIGNRPILESIARMDPQQRRAAEEILHRHEEQAAEGSMLNPGCVEVLQWIEEQRLPLALITRNSRRSVDVVLERHRLAIEVLITRDDGLFKPDPAPLLAACRRLGVDVRSSWMIGDGQYDVEGGQAAGARTIWLSHGQSRPFAAEPDVTVADLFELLNLLKTSVSG